MQKIKIKKSVIVKRGAIQQPKSSSDIKPSPKQVMFGPKKNDEQSLRKKEGISKDLGKRKTNI